MLRRAKSTTFALASFPVDGFRNCETIPAQTSNAAMWSPDVAEMHLANQVEAPEKRVLTGAISGALRPPWALDKTRPHSKATHMPIPRKAERN